MLDTLFNRLGTVILQGSSQPGGTVQLGLVAYELVGAVLGVVIAYLAYQGYRRNQSRPMLFIAVGFVLALGLPLATTILYFVLPVTGGEVAMQVLTQTFEIAGLLCIIYGLRV